MMMNAIYVRHSYQRKFTSSPSVFHCHCSLLPHHPAKHNIILHLYRNASEMQLCRMLCTFQPLTSKFFLLKNDMVVAWMFKLHWLLLAIFSGMQIVFNFFLKNIFSTSLGHRIAICDSARWQPAKRCIMQLHGIVPRQCETQWCKHTRWSCRVG